MGESSGVQVHIDVEYPMEIAMQADNVARLFSPPTDEQQRIMKMVNSRKWRNFEDPAAEPPKWVQDVERAAEDIRLSTRVDVGIDLKTWRPEDVESGPSTWPDLWWQSKWFDELIYNDVTLRCSIAKGFDIDVQDVNATHLISGVLKKVHANKKLRRALLKRSTFEKAILHLKRTDFQLYMNICSLEKVNFLLNCGDQRAEHSLLAESDFTSVPRMMDIRRDEIESELKRRAEIEDAVLIARQKQREKEEAELDCRRREERQRIEGLRRWRQQRRQDQERPEHVSAAGPSHTTPRSKAVAPRTHAEELERLQWKESASARTEAGRRKQAEAHSARLAREEAAEAAAAKAAFVEAQKAITIAGNRKAPKLTVAEVAGLL